MSTEVKLVRTEHDGFKGWEYAGYFIASYKALYPANRREPWEPKWYGWQPASDAPDVEFSGGTRAEVVGAIARHLSRKGD